MGFFGKLASKLRSSLYVFKKAEIMQNIVNKEIRGEYDNLCPSCYFNQRFNEHAKATGEYPQSDKLKLSIYLGGALGDYIIYLRFVDEISSICDCTVDLFLDRIGFGKYVYGKRENITIIHDAENCLFQNSVAEYDLAAALDHGLVLRNCNLGAIRDKAPLFYETACKIVEAAKRSRIDINKQNEREMVIMRMAKFFGDTKWSKLSCGGAINMSEMYSNVMLDREYLGVLDRYSLRSTKYITVNFGADKNMGGTAQTKVLPLNTLNEVIAKFKDVHPDYLVVQTGVKGSQRLDGADRYCFDCCLDETAIILKNSSCHVDSEGGLVHLSAQMSTTSVVSFGPTPVYYYSYPRNKNIVSPVCSDCMAVSPQWSTVCPRKMQVPACMQAITPDMIIEKINEVLAPTAPKKLTEITDMTRTDVLTSLCDERQPKRAAFVCALDEEVYRTALKLKKHGWTIAMYIGTELSHEIVAMRSLLKSSGVIVEFGNPLNIAKEGSSYDVVVCCSEDEENSDLENKECQRILDENGILYRVYVEKPTQSDTVADVVGMK